MILGFVGRATIQLCFYYIKSAKDNMHMNERGCVPIKLYLQKQEASWLCGLWAAGYSLPTSGVKPYVLCSVFIELTLKDIKLVRQAT